MELIAAHIHRKNARRAAFQQNLREAARGGAGIEADPALRRETEGIESRAELPSASRNISFGFKDLHTPVRPNLQSRFEHGLAIDTYRSAPDQVLRPRPRGGESLGHLELVQSHFHSKFPGLANMLNM